MSQPLKSPPANETDERFPSGRWTGFFLQPRLPGRHWMDLALTFRQGIVKGEGRDRIGPFQIRGRYELSTGKCWWSKHYLGKHSLVYHEYNEGRGIWGNWEHTRDQARASSGRRRWATRPAGALSGTQYTPP